MGNYLFAIVHRVVSDRTPPAVRLYTARCPIGHRAVYDGYEAERYGQVAASVIEDGIDFYKKEGCGTKVISKYSEPAHAESISTV